MIQVVASAAPPGGLRPSHQSGTERVWGAFDAACLVIKEPQVVVHKADQPDLLRDFLDADILSGEDLA